MQGRKEREESVRTAGQKRRDAIIEAAYRLFIEKGYGAVSVDDIIRISKGSKSSLYKFFGDKEGIMKAVVESLADKMLREIHVEFPSGRTPREALTRIGMVLVKLALSENAIQQHRQAVSHCRQFPDVAKLWYESGPKTTFDGIAAFLKKETDAGRLRVTDPVRAARFFGGMIIFEENMRRLVGMPPSNIPHLKQTVAEAVRVFLAAYGV